MGFLNISLGGSFVGHYGMTGQMKQFGAMQHGHADAVAQAIEYLASEVLPAATALDHELPRRGREAERRIRTPVTRSMDSAPGCVVCGAFVGHGDACPIRYEEIEGERDELRALLRVAYEALFHEAGMTPKHRDDMRRALTP